MSKYQCYVAKNVGMKKCHQRWAWLLSDHLARYAPDTGRCVLRAVLLADRPSCSNIPNFSPGNPCKAALHYFERPGHAALWIYVLWGLLREKLETCLSVFLVDLKLYTGMNTANDSFYDSPPKETFNESL